MLRGSESRWRSPDADSRVEAGQEIKWVYAASLPHVEGQPTIQVLLGVPEDGEWLHPDDALKPKEIVPGTTVYNFDLPVNVVATDTARMAATGSVRAYPNGAIVFRVMNLSQHSSDHGKAWPENAERVSVEIAGLLSEAIVKQCKTYLAARADCVSSDQR